MDRVLIERMCAALEHRGPDSRGVHLTGPAGLGIQRLRVIDLETGDQPIFNEDRSVAVVLNGEIYNYRELRRDLVAAGHTFTTESDTEVIAHLYEEEGAECVSRLHGMFAFAVWDDTRSQLLLARDRVGKKPLFYAELAGGGIAFASEIQALRQDAEIPSDVDHQALDCYLAFQYVPAPMSAYSSIRKLPPASVLVHREGRSQLHSYWRLDYASKAAFSSTEEAHEAIRDRLLEAVRTRLVADVPVGAFLSGGVDSSGVVAAMARVASGAVRTFSIGFESAQFNELEHARVVAQQYGTEHHEFVVRPDAMAMIPKIVRHYGEPFADSSAVPSFYLAELARRHVTVALNGDGGDESFAGYPRYAHQGRLQRVGRLPAPVRRAVAAATRLLPSNGRKESTFNRARRLGETIDLDAPERYVAYMSSMGGGLDRGQLYTPAYRAEVGRSVASDVILGPWRDSDGPDLVDVMLDVDTRTYLPGDLLTKIDIATMAFSLEARSPMLDHRFLELAASLPSTMKVRDGELKVGLRGALEPWLPPGFLDRPKRGFEVPVAEWMRGPLRGDLEDVLFDAGARSRGQFDQGYVRRLLDRHVDGAEDNSKGLWTLLMLELWYQEFVDRRPTSPMLRPTPVVSD